MRVMVLSSYPYVDSHPHKILFLKLLLERLEASQIALCYVQSSLRHHIQRARQQFQITDALRLFKIFRQQSAQQPELETELKDVPRGKVMTIARRWGVAVHLFSKMGQLRRFAEDFGPDIIHNFSGAFIPRSLLKIAPAGVVSGHYGELPALRGGDTIRWTIFLNYPMVLTVMRLAPELDMGDILLKRRVPVYRGDTIALLRFRCQITNALAQIEAFDRWQAGTLIPVPQRREDGSTFYRMGQYLRSLVDQRLQMGQYSHFEVR